MAGELKFSLGLVTAGLLSGIASADARMKGFIGGVISLGAVTRGVMGAIGEGAELERLHKRTGATVYDLVKIREGFQAAGLSSEEAGIALFMMQKSLGGVDEMGKGTHLVFERMGLSMSKLKAMGAPEAMRQIVGALGKMNQSDAAKSASTIFGRGNAGNMMELARSTKEFADGMANASGKAKLMEENAAAFHRFTVTIREITDTVSTMFAGIAAGIVPALQQIGDMIKKLDLIKIGTEIGKYLRALVQAFSEGSLSELIAQSFRTGFDIVLAMAPAVFERLGYFLLVALETPLTLFQAMLDGIVDRQVANAVSPNDPVFGTDRPENREQQQHQLARLDELHKKGKLSDARYARLVKEASSLENYQADDPASVYKERFQKGLELYNPGYGLDQLNKDTDKALKDGLERSRKSLEPLLALINSIVMRAPPGKWIPPQEEKKEELPAFNVDFTVLEKMGFVMSGLGNSNLQLRTATATERIADIAEAYWGHGEPIHEMA